MSLILVRKPQKLVDCECFFFFLKKRRILEKRNILKFDGDPGIVMITCNDCSFLHSFDIVFFIIQSNKLSREVI